MTMGNPTAWPISSWDPPAGFFGGDFRAPNGLLERERVPLARAAAQRLPVDTHVEQITDLGSQGWFVQILIPTRERCHQGRNDPGQLKRHLRSLARTVCLQTR